MMDVDLDGTIVLLARVAEAATFRRVNGTRHAGDNCTSGSERTRFTGTLGGNPREAMSAGGSSRHCGGHTVSLLGATVSEDPFGLTRLRATA